MGSREVGNRGTLESPLGWSGLGYRPFLPEPQFFPGPTRVPRGSHSLLAWPLPGPMNSKNMMDPEFK